MRSFCLFVLMIICSFYSSAQSSGFAINSNGSSATGGAILDVSSSNKGVLLPRVALQSTTSSFPLTGFSGPVPTSLIVYNTATTVGINSVSPGFYYWNGSLWVKLLTDLDGWGLNGNLATSPVNNYIGTRDYTDLNIATAGASSIYIKNQSNFIGLGENNPGDNLVLKLNSRSIYPTPGGYSGITLKSPFVGSGGGNNIGFQIGLDHSNYNNARLMNYTAGADLILGANNWESLRIRGSNSFIGINEPNPQDNLVIRLNPAAITGSPDSYSGILLSPYGNSYMGAGNNSGFHIGLENNNFSNPNVRLWNNQNSDMIFGVNRSEVMRINASRYSVGINTSTPQHTLSVAPGFNGLGSAPFEGVHVTNTLLSDLTNPYTGLVIGTDVNLQPGYNKGIWNYDNGSLSFGTNNLSRMIITAEGKVGINTPSPVAKLHLTEGDVVFNSTGIIPALAADPPVSGSSRRMMWYSDKAAFRTGYALADEWDNANVGNYSFAAGYGPKAKGDNSIAIGVQTRALANYSFVVGGQSEASALYSSVFGYNSYAAGVGSTALGNSAAAYGTNSVSIGAVSVTSINAAYSIALGASATTGGYGSASMGYSSSTIGDYSVAIGNTTTSWGMNSTTMGFNTIAKAPGSTSIGSYNDINDNPSYTIEASTDRIFQLGNGTGSGRSNAITVLRNGNVGIGLLVPAEKLHVFGNIRATSLSGASTRLITADANGTLTPLASGTNGQVLTMVSGSPAWQNSAGSGWQLTGNSGTNPSTNFLGTTDAVDLAFRTNNLERIRITSAGNIGIGTSTPTNRLDIAGTDAWDLAGTEGDMRIGNSSYRMKFGVALTGGGAGAASIMQYGQPGGYNALQLGSQGVLSVYVMGSGNVGIGASNPSAYGHGGTNKILEIKNSAAAGSNIQSHVILSSTGTSGSLGGITWAATGLSGEQRTGFIGNVYETINQTKLSFYTRDNAGTLAERFYLQGTGNAWLQGTLTQNSDARLKTKIRRLPSALDKIKQLNGYSYYWIDSYRDNDPQLGVLAQEVKNVYPELVKENNQGEMSVNYSGLVPVLIEGMKEQQKQIDELKREMEELKKLIRKN